MGVNVFDRNSVFWIITILLFCIGISWLIHGYKVTEPPTISMSGGVISMKTVLWRLGSKGNSLEWVRIDQQSSSRGYEGATISIGPRISFSYDIAAEAKNWKRQRAEAADAGSEASAFQTGSNPTWCDSSGERDCGLYRDQTGKCDSMAVNDCMFYRI